jgi:hypothetical protein
MVLPTSGTIGLKAIQTEFGGTNPISLKEYYRGGSFVPNLTASNANIPTSGTIGLEQFYGARKYSATPLVPSSWTGAATGMTFVEYSSNTTWSKPSGVANDQWVIVYAIGGGGATSEYDAGASGSDKYSTGGGGGGGGYIASVRGSVLNGASFVVGAGAIGTGTRQTDAPSGSASTITLTDSTVYTAGGGQGGTSSSGGGDGGTGGTGGYTWDTSGGNSNPFASNTAADFNGGKGGRATNTAGVSSIWGAGGGAGGSSNPGTAGTSTNAGNGGAFRVNGSVPGGGAGHDEDAGHTDGGNGRIRVWYES